MSSEEIDGFDDTSGIRITDIPHVDLKETSNVTLGSRYLSTTPQSHSQQSSLSSELPSTTLSSPVSDKKGEPSTVIQENILPVIDAVQEPEPLPNGFWDHKSILTCDGGGIRGYASLLMIAALMRHIGDAERSGKYGDPHYSSFCPCQRISSRDAEKSTSSDKATTVKSSTNNEEAKPEDLPIESLREGEELLLEYLPCHYFDYMIGTSTGGLIAVMLSRWRMSVDEALKKYEMFGAGIFHRSRRAFSIAGWPHNKHHKQPLVDVLKLVTEQRVPASKDKVFRRFKSPNDLCRTAVIAVQKSRDGTTEEAPFIFRSYDLGLARKPVDLADLPRNYDDSRNHEIWEVCRATTAAPFYFKPLVIEGDEYSDGGTMANNPTIEALREIRRLHTKCSKLFASFGTGKAVKESTFMKQTKNHPHILRALNRAGKVLGRARGALVDCQNIHEAIEELLKNSTGGPDYRRFNVEDGLGKMKLNEWKSARDDEKGGKCSTLRYIQICTERELAKQSVQEELKALATQLVKLRRSRAIDEDRWERFACCTSFKCLKARDCNTPTEEHTFSLKRDMKRHLVEKHHWLAENLEIEAMRCRREPEFPAGPF